VNRTGAAVISLKSAFKLIVDIGTMGSVGETSVSVIVGTGSFVSGSKASAGFIVIRRGEFKGTNVLVVIKVGKGLKMGAMLVTTNVIL
jgi:hypothetical protein